MLIIPAIDLKDSKCVRLFQGRMDKVSVFSDSPATMAKKWEDTGAKMLHIVDLNGAVNGKPENLETIKEIIETVNISIQVGGGIRNRDTVDSYLSMGVTRVIIGTSALTDRGFLKDICEKYPGRILIGVDAKDGFVAVDGWTHQSNTTIYDFVEELKELNPAAIIYTDIKRDGAMKGPNIESTRNLAQATDIPVIASGGISTIDDVKEVCTLEQFGVSGMIIGRAIYTGAISLPEALVCTLK